MAITYIIRYNLYFILSNHSQLFIIFFIIYSSLKYLSFYSNNFTFYFFFHPSLFTFSFETNTWNWVAWEAGRIQLSSLVTSYGSKYHRTCMVWFMGSQTYPTRKLL